MTADYEAERRARYEDEYTDPDGMRMRILASADHAPGTYLLALDAEGDEAAGIAVPAHRLAEFTGRLYEAAGQPVPDLPQILNAADVGDLAKLINFAVNGTTGPGNSHHQAWARVLLAHGWRRP